MSVPSRELHQLFILKLGFFHCNGSQADNDHQRMKKKYYQTLHQPIFIFELQINHMCECTIP